jgi:predicted nucleic acid-binding protein
VTFFVDTNVLVYALTTTQYQQPCAALTGRIASGEADGCTSVVVIEELWHLELRRRPLGLEGAAIRYLEVFSPVLGIDQHVLAAAFDLRASNLGAADRVHVATCAASGIDTIVTADESFDGVDGLRRVDPLDRQALAGLWR